MNFKTSISDRASFLHASILATNDGLVTTFAVIAGSLGADLDPRVIVILGIANLFADGFSMATGNYLGSKGEEEYEKSHNLKEKTPAFITGLVTFTAFVIAGSMPIFPYLLKLKNPFEYSVAIMAGSLIIIGVVQGIFTKKNIIYTGTRSLIIGGTAATVAYLIGDFLKGLPL